MAAGNFDILIPLRYKTGAAGPWKGRLEMKIPCSGNMRKIGNALGAQGMRSVRESRNTRNKQNMGNGRNAVRFLSLAFVFSFLSFIAEIFSVFGAVGVAQEKSGPQAAPPQQEPPAVLKVTTRLVTVDVVARDRHGNAVRDLKADDFQITERTQKRTTDRILPAAGSCHCTGS